MKPFLLLLCLLPLVSLVEGTTTLPWWHPKMMALLRNGTGAPVGHPPITVDYIHLYNRTHINVDQGILQNPVLPAGHPNVDSYFVIAAPPNPISNITADYYHPNTDYYYNAGVPIDMYHPSVQTMMQSILPSGHGNVDYYLMNPAANPLPFWHPKLETLYTRRPVVQFTPISVPPWHPDVSFAYSLPVDCFPCDHPSVENMLQSILPPYHPNVDMLLLNSSMIPLPVWHPPLNSFINFNGGPSYANPAVSIPADHPDITLAYDTGMALIAGHPSIWKFMLPWVPYSHPNIDELVANATNGNVDPLPPWHIPLEKLVRRRSVYSPGLILSLIMAALFVALAVSRFVSKIIKRIKRKQVDKAYAQKRKAQVKSVDAGHHRKPSSFAYAQSKPTNSEEVELQETMRMKPGWQEFTTDDGIPYYYNAATGETQWEKPVVKVITLPIHPIPNDPENVLLEVGPIGEEGGTDGEGNDGGARWHHNPLNELGYRRHKGHSSWGPAEPQEAVPSRDLNLYTAMKKHAAHRGASFYDEKDVIAAQLASGAVSKGSVSLETAKKVFGKGRARAATVEARQALKKKNNCVKSLWKKITQTRIAYTQWTTGNVIFLATYILINFISIVLSANYPFDIGCGSLAAANTMLLVIPATRNSLLVWFLGMPFDSVVLYHRFLGRFTIFLSALHYLLIKVENTYTSNFHFITGIVALACGLVIAITSLDWVRRNKFTIFFFSHYTFVGFYGFLWAHSSLSRPFLIVGITLYGLDCLLRIVWTWIPRRTLVFRNRSDTVAQVRFPKNPLNELTGRHKIGQYMFVNFPTLSLTEWHPFSVSSGPHDDHVEVHIRALGDHTTKIVEYAKQCTTDTFLPWIRTDGPYGLLDFNFRRYEVVVLVGGGVGITPVIGILKDIYLRRKQIHADTRHHCMQHVYVVWVMPDGKEADVFLEVFQECIRVADASTTLPSLTTSIYCTRAQPGSVSAPLMAGRPNFPLLLADASPPDIASTLVFACGPQVMVNHIWDECIQMNTKTHRVDFHHETFEF